MQGGDTGLAWEQWKGQGRRMEGMEARQRGSALVPWCPEEPLLAPEQGSEGCEGTRLSVLPASLRNPSGGRF